MNIRILSNYDIAKNLLNIINNAEHLKNPKPVQGLKSSVVSDVSNLSKNVNSCDAFVKQSEKEIHK